MCTSIYTETKDSKHLLARTMDFSYELDPQIVFLPRNHKWTPSSENKSFVNKYGFVGSGKNLDGSYFVADGVNEKGLSAAELYLPGEAVYHDDKSSEKINLASHEFIIWLLGNFESIEELTSALKTVQLMNVSVPVLNILTPLHWIITDKSGKSVVIEPTDLNKPLTIKENPIGVMTNTPKLEWHIENLRNYLHVQPKQYSPKKYGEFEAKPFSQGTGTLGLPGGYTPPERFVRATFFKENIKEANDELEGVHNSLEILSTVKIPKNVVITADDQSDYSQYIIVMCNETGSVYLQNYGTNEISKVSLTPELLSSDQVVEFKTKNSLTITNLNERGNYK
ncbi:choloylglycine hydrolase family protein [Lactococcus sp. S64]|uniref:choloylglycine hydrolase family protein n=1 Tax=Lactococcus sp. S64 TaxID=2767459 RepID=UPI001905E900|nr:choloylglycine hydrolase family protein [Lactococcus sp. S64]MBK0084447.1 choloylglycine hydrolase family protein [Lactococcus sp. S64]